MKQAFREQFPGFENSPFVNGAKWINDSPWRSWMRWPYFVLALLVLLIGATLIIFGQLVADTGGDFLSLFDSEEEKKPAFPPIDPE